ncbi:TetR/AcrR family transcriptional regulator [Streptomyces lomondensis]|uniref:TetR family transcriptional regulator n=1 Tax=Streptomyces lomondensis TaxID=68229 RepID=A0ABQ2XL76_9ACTN|nr:TetR/AcrR family transcriptional regulator [Streptomyces lomondensis]MCF0076622.1 TetR/AcrR family transcriptional regulator [Streptomyces lomondensis]GGX23132.1 TetR family transcriptional regulator [Streptomyces lomondensis]
MKTKAPHDLDTAGTRERIVRTASRLMQRQGYEGTGIKQISREAGATLGSLYHFFPGGKQELGTAAVRLGDEEFTELLRETLDAEPEPEKALLALTASLAQGLRDSDWLDGCPVTSMVVGTATSAPGIQQAAAEAFTRWRGVVAGKLVAAGFSETDADELAHTVIATLEGAELAAQVARSGTPLEVAGRHLARLVASYR